MRPGTQAGSVGRKGRWRSSSCAEVKAGRCLKAGMETRWWGCKWGLGGLESLARRIEIGPGACYLLLLLMGGLLPSGGDFNF